MVGKWSDGVAPKARSRVNSLDTDFHRRLVKRLGEVIQSDTTSLATGYLDHLEYKRVCGRLQAFQGVIELCTEIESQITQGK